MHQSKEKKQTAGLWNRMFFFVLSLHAFYLSFVRIELNFRIDKL